MNIVRANASQEKFSSYTEIDENSVVKEILSSVKKKGTTLSLRTPVSSTRQS